MQITAKLIELLPLQTGTGKNGEWKKQEIIVDTEGQHPKKVCVSVWGDKINMSQLQIGNKLKIDFDVESREYNGKWYTDIKAWRIDSVGPNPQITGETETKIQLDGIDEDNDGILIPDFDIDDDILEPDFEIDNDDGIFIPDDENPPF